MGTACLLAGLRGRRIDDHPVCRRCRFDLIGVYPSSAAMARCPECGADLGHRRAVRIGQRRRRKLAVSLGVGLLLAVSGVGAVLGWSAAKGPAMNPYKPSWWLEAEAKTG